MHASLVILAGLSALASAAPTPLTIPGLPINIANLIPKYLPAPPAGSCPLTSVAQPSSSLPAPDSGLTLAFVAIGRGTQNYTCATSDASSVPAAIGANATLFNASCIASHMNDSMLAQITAALEKMSVSSIPLPQAGQHFFVDTTTPAFDIPTMGGLTELKKENTTNAPANTEGDVAWLKLLAQTTGTTTNIKNIYRLNTVGGSAPANCAGQPASIQVDYAADYFFYTSS